MPDHTHDSDQLIYATGGVMEVSADKSVWLIPPHFAAWIPARTVHSIRMPEAVSMRTLYLRHRLAARMPQTCTVIHVTPLLRELIVEAVRLGELRIRNHLQSALRDLLIYQLESASPVPMFVTLPKERRALAIALAVTRDPAARFSLASMCSSAGVSVRTIQRVFRRDVGTDFQSWRRQVRLTKAVELLVAGHSVKEVCFALGYQQPSAFVQMFRETLGTTPKAWISALQRLD